MRTAQHSLWTLAVAFACLGLVAGAATAAPRQVATLSGGGAGVEFRPVIEYDKLVLTVSGPDGMSFRREFAQGQAATFSAFGKGGQSLPNGSYTYELLAVPRFSPEVRQRLAAARRQGNERAVLAELRQAGLLPKGTVQSGGFVMENGTFIVAGGVEETGPKAAKEALRAVTAADQVIPDDLIVQGSECVGLDCVNNENFGFDTIRLKENNLRIHFDDTSTQAGFPANDWRIIANDSASGGSSKFSIEDSTSSKTPFTITAGASTNSIFVDSTGRVGFRTSTPVLDLHIATSNTPAIRLEQNNSGGFTAQTWDIGANEANFFIRDVTGGSRLSFRIRPGAPTSSIDISNDGEVGIGGVASANAKLHVLSGETRLDSTDAGILDSFFNFSGNGRNYFRGTTIIGDRAGDNVGIGCDSPGFDLVVGGTTSNCATAPFSRINAGDANWVGSSSRTVKQNILPIEVPDILDKIEAVDVFTYDFINGSKNRMGLMAEDFHQVFGRGSDQMLDSGEVQMALWLAVQQLTAQNQGLTERLAALEAQLAAEKSGQPEKHQQ